MSLARVLFLSLFATSVAAQASPENGGGPPAETRGVEITYLANAGFYLRAPHTNQAVLIDACVREPIALHAALPSSVHGKLTNVKPPFDGPMLVLVSHDHADHVQPRVLEKLLVKNTGARLVTSPQVIQTLQASAGDFEAIRSRVEPVATVPGTPQTIEQEGLRVDFLRLEHSGKGHERLEHLGHLIELGGLRILHVGDAEPTPVNFAAYHLDAKPIDVAIVPYWYLGSAGGAEVLREQVHARFVIVSHVPPGRWDELSEFLKAEFPDVILFKTALEKQSFLPVEAPPASGASGGAAGSEGG